MKNKKSLVVSVVVPVYRCEDFLGELVGRAIMAIMSLWVAGTVAGVLLGGNLAYPGAWGPDAAFPATFVVLLVPHVVTPDGRQTAPLGSDPPMSSS